VPWEETSSGRAGNQVRARQAGTIDLLYCWPMDSGTHEAIEKLTKIVETGFASVGDDLADVRSGFADVHRDIADVRGDISGVKQTMAAKADFHDLKLNLEDTLASKQVLSQLHRAVMLEIKDIAASLKNIGGFGKEIDHAFERISAIEKHLGIKKKIAA
jgi:hypothetical protein